MSLLEKALKKIEESKKEPEEKKKKEIIPEIKKSIKSKKTKKLAKKSKISGEKTISKEFNLNSELEELAKTSEFQRLIYKALLGKVHRGSKEDLTNKLGITLKQLRKLNE